MHVIYTRLNTILFCFINELLSWMYQCIWISLHFHTIFVDRDLNLMLCKFWLKFRQEVKKTHHNVLHWSHNWFRHNSNKCNELLGENVLFESKYYFLNSLLLARYQLWGQYAQSVSLKCRGALTPTFYCAQSPFVKAVWLRKVQREKCTIGEPISSLLVTALAIILCFCRVIYTVKNPQRNAPHPKVMGRKTVNH